MRNALVLSLAATALLPVSAGANGWQDLAIIDRAVAEFTGTAIGQPGGAQAPVDRQLRLAPCTQPLAVDWYARDAVRVGCPAAGGWRVFVPVNVVRTPAAETATPAVARRDLLRVEADGRGFRIARQGEAMEAGHVGDSIRVKLDDGTRQGRIVTAQVIEPGRAQISRR